MLFIAKLYGLGMFLISNNKYSFYLCAKPINKRYANGWNRRIRAAGQGLTGERQ